MTTMMKASYFHKACYAHESDPLYDYAASGFLLLVFLLAAQR